MSLVSGHFTGTECPVPFVMAWLVPAIRPPESQRPAQGGPALNGSPPSPSGAFPAAPSMALSSKSSLKGWELSCFPAPWPWEAPGGGKTGRRIGSGLRARMTELGPSLACTGDKPFSFRGTKGQSSGPEWICQASAQPLSESFSSQRLRAAGPCSLNKPAMGPQPSGPIP